MPGRNQPGHITMTHPRSKQLISAIPAPAGAHYATTYLVRGDGCAPALILATDRPDALAISAIRVTWLGGETNSLHARSLAIAAAERLGIVYDGGRAGDLPDWDDCPDPCSGIYSAHSALQDAIQEGA